MKKSTLFIGCDPSYAHFGLSIIDKDAEDIFTFDIETTLGSHDFKNICEKAKEQVDKVIATVEKYVGTWEAVGMENALPFSFNAVELTALDVLLYYKFGKENTALFNPNYLSYIMGKHTKKDSVNLATALIGIFEKHGYTHIIKSKKKTLTDGEAESFIYAVRIYCRLNDDEITKEVLELQPLFNTEKEIYSDNFIY